MIHEKLHKIGIHHWEYYLHYNNKPRRRKCTICGKIQQRKDAFTFSNIFDTLFPHWFDLL